ncbi:DUF1045 domain-containing protein [Paracoccus sp. Z118]|uniref:DUF1045 domain-containing protein n=1 Tax=Paracoccus sp. Z118 TaxID=2851017 RepID=UPI001C2C07F5|nr:DUF1045 domain-containing protein [Paracoccus sp. Z118]MBV0891982.1 DUF1045 domain-containing protein [Paracoccus sp. Z118]
MTSQTDISTAPEPQKARPHEPRYAIYAMPEGDFAAAGARWLGWDVVSGRLLEQPGYPDLPRPLPELTTRPQRYGFHATIKAPMRLAKGASHGDLLAALKDSCARLAPVEIDLTLSEPGQFLHFRPARNTAALSDLAAAIVRDLDHLRRPLTEQEITRRNPGALTPRQQEMLARFGYPYVLDEFRLHLTLSDPLPAEDHAAVRGAAERHFAGKVPSPWRIDRMWLLEEDAAGFFHLRDCVPLKG